MKNLFQTFKKINVNRNRAFFSPNRQSKLMNPNLFKTCSPVQKNLRNSEKEINNFYIQEINKAKYQGFFDPGSDTNKNIYIDNSILINNSQISPSKKNNLFKSPDISNRKLLIENEGKNLLISKSESKYPLITYKRRINERSIKNINSCYIENKLDCSNIQSVKTNLFNRNIVELNKGTQNIYFFKDQNKKILQNIGNNSNLFSNINNGFNDFNKYEKFGKNVNFGDSGKENQVNKNVDKLIDDYLSKLLQLFIEHIKIFLKKIILKEFYKIFQNYIEKKDKNMSKNKIHKFIDKKTFNKGISHISLFYNSQDKNRQKNFKKYANNTNVKIEKKNIYYNGNSQKKYDFDNLNHVINKNKNKSKKIFKSVYTAKINNLKKIISSNYKNRNTNLKNRINTDSSKFENNSQIRNQFSNITLIKKSPKYKFSHIKKQSHVSQNYLFQNNNLKTNLQKTIPKKESNISNIIDIKPQKIFNYISSDNKISITIKNYLYNPKIENNKSTVSKKIYFDKNLLKITNIDNFYLLFETKEDHKNKNYCTPETNCENLGNSINSKNIDNFNNSEKINKGILLLQNFINKSYEEEFSKSNISIESELTNNYIGKKEKEKIYIKNNVKEEEIKNNINSKLAKIITSIESKKNQNILKCYFDIFHSLLNNKIKKQLIVQKIVVLRKIQKTVLSNENKNASILLENNSEEIFDNSKIKNPSEFSSPINFDKIKNNGNFNENSKITDINSIKLGNESRDYSFVSVSLASKFYNSKNINELIKNKDESFNEYYDKYQTFIFSFRSLLLVYSLNKKNSGKD